MRKIDSDGVERIDVRVAVDTLQDMNDCGNILAGGSAADVGSAFVARRVSLLRVFGGINMWAKDASNAAGTPPTPGAPMPVDVVALAGGIRTPFTPKVGHVTAFSIATAPGARTLDVSMAEHGGEPTLRRMWLGASQDDRSNMSNEALAGGGPEPHVFITLDGSAGFRGGDTIWVLHAYEHDIDGSGGQAKEEASALDVKLT